jgi:SAM-dependent methyltransferase
MELPFDKADIDKLARLDVKLREAVPKNVHPEVEIRFSQRLGKQRARTHFDLMSMMAKMVHLYRECKKRGTVTDLDSYGKIRIYINNTDIDPANPARNVRITKEYFFAEGREPTITAMYKERKLEVFQTTDIDGCSSRVVSSEEISGAPVPPGGWYRTATSTLAAIIRVEFPILPRWSASFSIRLDLSGASKEYSTELFENILQHPLFTRTPFSEYMAKIESMIASGEGKRLAFPFDLDYNDCEIEFEFENDPTGEYEWMKELQAAYAAFFVSATNENLNNPIMETAYRYLIPLVDNPTSMSKRSTMYASLVNGVLKFNQIACQVTTMSRDEWITTANGIEMPLAPQYYVSEKIDGDRVILIFDISTIGTDFKVDTYMLKADQVTFKTNLYDSAHAHIMENIIGISIFDCESYGSTLYAFDILQKNARGFSPDSNSDNALYRTADIRLQQYSQRYETLSRFVPMFASIIKLYDPSCEIVVKKQELLKRTKLAEQMKSAFDASTREGLPRDGIILTPAAAQYYNKSTYKIKPPAKNTVDFLLCVVPPQSGNFISETLRREREKSPLFDESRLRAGSVFCLFTTGEKSYPGVAPFARILGDPPIIDRFRKEANRRLETKRDYRTTPYPFVTAIRPSSFLYVFEPSSTMRDQNELNEKVCEMYYEDDRWKFSRIRHDRTAEYVAGKGMFGNYYEVAFSNFGTILNPVTIELLCNPFIEQDTGAPYFKTVSPAVRDLYEPYRKLNHLAKCRTMDNLPTSVIDFSAGRGADIMPMLYGGARNILATDADMVGLLELEKRTLQNLSMLKKLNPDYVQHRIGNFAPMSAKVDATNSISGTMLSYETADPARFMPSGTCNLETIVHKIGDPSSVDTDQFIEKIRKSYIFQHTVANVAPAGRLRRATAAEIAAETAAATKPGFMFGSIHLTIHYFFDRKAALDEFVRTAAAVIAPGGKLCISYPDGDKIHAAFNANGEIAIPFEGKSPVPSTFPLSEYKYYIKKKYTKANPQGDAEFGKTVAFLNRQFDPEPRDEFLVFRRTLEQQLSPAFRPIPGSHFSFGAAEIVAKFHERFGDARQSELPNAADRRMSGLYSCMTFERVARDAPVKQMGKKR